MDRINTDVVRYGNHFAEPLLVGIEQLFGTEKMGCPNIQPHKFGGQLRTQISLPMAISGNLGQSGLWSC